MYEETTSDKLVEIYNLIPKTYYWKVVGDSGEESITGVLNITDTLRLIDCGNVVNMRDEGGYVG